MTIKVSERKNKNVTKKSQNMRSNKSKTKSTSIINKFEHSGRYNDLII